MFVTKNYNGSITISDLVGGFRVAKTYYGYTVNQAKKDFKQVVGV